MSRYTDDGEFSFLLPNMEDSNSSDELTKSDMQFNADADPEKDGINKHVTVNPRRTSKLCLSCCS